MGNAFCYFHEFDTLPIAIAFLRRSFWLGKISSIASTRNRTLFNSNTGTFGIVRGYNTCCAIDDPISSMNRYYLWTNARENGGGSLALTFLQA